MKHEFLTGQKLYLRGLEKADLAGNMFQWHNDAEVTRYMISGAMPNTPAVLEAEYEQLTASPNDVVLAMVDQATDAHIGNIGLYNIRWLVRAAELRIIIGEKAYWGQGCGLEAIRLMLDYAFQRLNLNKVFLGVNAAHQPALACYQHAGFVWEGVLRQEIFRDGVYYDAVRMSILRGEYQAAGGA